MSFPGVIGDEIVTVVPCGRPKVPEVLVLPPEIRGHVWVGLNNMSNDLKRQLKEKLEEFPEVTVLDVPGPGAMNARQSMVMHLPQSYRSIICLDDDAAPGPSYFSNIRRTVEKYPESVIFGVLRQKKGTGWANRFQYWWQWLGRIGLKRWLPAYYIAGNSIWPRDIAQSVFSQMGTGYRAGGEEIEGFYLLKKKKIPMVYCPDIYCYHENKPFRQLLKTFFCYGKGQTEALYRIRQHEECGVLKAFTCLLGNYKKDCSPMTIQNVKSNPRPPELSKKSPGIRILLWTMFIILLKFFYFCGFITGLVEGE